jgi:hypothetical protein
MHGFNQWHRTKVGFLAFALIELGIAYGFMSLSIDRGNLWYYLLTLIFLIGALRNFFGLIGSLMHGRHQAGKAR